MKRSEFQVPARHWSPLALSWLAALWMGLLANWPLWQRMLLLPELEGAKGWGFIALFAGMVIALHGALLSLLAWPRLFRPVLGLCLLSAAAAAHFMGAYGTVMDPTMMVNVLQTDLKETRDLLSLRLLLSLLLLGLLPAFWLWRQPVAPQSWLKRLGLNLAGFIGGLALMVGLAMSSYADLASTMRNYPSLRYMMNPLAPFWSLGVVAVESGKAPDGPPAVVAADARWQPANPQGRPRLLVLFVGETARAANFSLNGYERPTNPRLSTLDVLSFRQATSCGTSTAASLPCMFSHLGRSDFLDHGADQENLLDALHRAGLAVLWLDNQSGCKGLCDRVPHAHAAEAAGKIPLPAGLCAGGECLDMALLHDLDTRLQALDAKRRERGVVLVLHPMGSHGPAYFKRSPESQKPFTPECRSNALQQCPREQVVNAYDNSIVYADTVLAETIGWLERQKGFDVSLLYVSDHGESLGENKLYLHGVPYAVAPKEQTQVPWIVWLPEASAQRYGVDRRCLREQLETPISHDWLSHTVLGLAEVHSAIYRPEWDLMRRCRRAP
ncbi:phosphoethanolamine transferase [Roseateles sp. DB2]|uniref:phosphoethanolamine transferase n=1 Tax=Roseateles sp. DB2 TaxID=3453717 RepID=UPI003EED4DDC